MSPAVTVPLVPGYTPSVEPPLLDPPTTPADAVTPTVLEAEPAQSSQPSAEQPEPAQPSAPPLPPPSWAQGDPPPVCPRRHDEVKSKDEFVRETIYDSATGTIVARPESEPLLYPKGTPERKEQEAGEWREWHARRAAGVQLVEAAIASKNAQEHQLEIKQKLQRFREADARRAQGNSFGATLANLSKQITKNANEYRRNNMRTELVSMDQVRARNKDDRNRQYQEFSDEHDFLHPPRYGDGACPRCGSNNFVSRKSCIGRDCDLEYPVGPDDGRCFGCGLDRQDSPNWAPCSECKRRFCRRCGWVSKDNIYPPICIHCHKTAAKEVEGRRTTKTTTTTAGWWSRLAGKLYWSTTTTSTMPYGGSERRRAGRPRTISLQEQIRSKPQCTVGTVEMGKQRMLTPPPGLENSPMPIETAQNWSTPVFVQQRIVSTRPYSSMVATSTVQQEYPVKMQDAHAAGTTACAEGAYQPHGLLDLKVFDLEKAEEFKKVATAQWQSSRSNRHDMRCRDVKAS